MSKNIFHINTWLCCIELLTNLFIVSSVLHGLHLCVLLEVTGVKVIYIFNKPQQMHSVITSNLYTAIKETPLRSDRVGKR